MPELGPVLPRNGLLGREFASMLSWLLSGHIQRELVCQSLLLSQEAK